MRVKIHHEGIGLLIVMLLAFAAINVPLWICVRPLALAIVVTAISGVIYLLCVNFFRSPRRFFSGDRKNVVVASADGKVVALEKTFESEYAKCDMIQLSVFMSVFNVHANWFPVDGEVVYTKHHSGRFMAAYLPKSSSENECATTAIRTPDGQLVVVRQIAGAMARRIVTYAHPGIEASIDDHMGFIKFGSRVDIFLPLGTKTKVKIGDKTIGGVTEVARLKPSLK